MSGRYRQAVHERCALARQRSGCPPVPVGMALDVPLQAQIETFQLQSANGKWVQIETDRELTDVSHGARCAPGWVADRHLLGDQTWMECQQARTQRAIDA